MIRHRLTFFGALAIVVGTVVCGWLFVRLALGWLMVLMPICPPQWGCV